MRKMLLPAIVAVLICIMAVGCGKSKKENKVIPEVIPITEAVSPSGQNNGQEGNEPLEKADESDQDETMEEETLKVDFTKVTSIDPAVTMYAVSNVNVRLGPATDFESIGMLKLGESIEVIGQDEGGWFEFTYKGNTVFACDDYLSDEEPAIPTAEAANEKEEGEVIKESDGKTTDVADAEQTELNALEKLIAEMSAQEEAGEASEPTPEVIEPSSVLIIGDSRSVMMKNATGGGGCSWICKIGKGYKWFESTALPEADEMIGNGTRVVIALGVNDIGNVNRYARLVNTKAAEWVERGAITYFVSVNPVQNIASVTEDQVVFFNDTIRAKLENVRWIDTHSYLINNGYTLTDGLHFDNATSKRVFQVIMDSL